MNVDRGASTLTVRVGRGTALVLLVIVPILFAAPTYDTAIMYFDAGRNLRTYVYSGFNWPSPRPEYLVDASLWIGKSYLGDRLLHRNFTFVISGNYTPTVAIANIDHEMGNWSYSAYPANPTTQHTVNSCQSSGQSENCVHFTSGFIFADSVITTSEWDEFGVLNAPMDAYTTTQYCVWLDRPFAFDDINVTYSLPLGYRAGVTYVEKTRAQFPSNIEARIPQAVGQISCFQLQVLREPLVFLPLVVYTTAPLFILYYLAAMTLITVSGRKDRLKIYAGCLFATFGYFFSLRGVMQSVVSLIDVLAILIMTIWILLEAGIFLLCQREEWLSRGSFANESDKS